MSGEHKEGQNGSMKGKDKPTLKINALNLENKEITSQLKLTFCQNAKEHLTNSNSKTAIFFKAKFALDSLVGNMK